VTVQGTWLLDATIGNIGSVDGVHVPPVVARIPATWFEPGDNCFDAESAGWRVWYRRFYLQRGWKTSDAFRRRSWWTISEAIVEAVRIARLRGTLEEEVEKAA
jgi:hypothetical protein